MRRVPHGVAVLTVDVDGERLGLTLDSLVSLSLDPPLVGVSISRQAAMHELLREAGAFASEPARRRPGGGGSALRARASRRSRCGTESSCGGDDGPPLLAGALGWARCRTVAEHPAGDHTVFLGEVDWVEGGEPRPPLVHVDGDTGRCERRLDGAHQRAEVPALPAPEREMIQAVVFDLDGVLIQTEELWDEVRESMARAAGGRYGEEEQRAMMGMSSPEWSRFMHEHVGLPESPDEIAAEVVRRMSARYREQLPLIDGAIEAVERLAARWPLGVASSSNRELIDLVLELSGLDRHFRATVSSEEVARGKPAPDVYLEACRRLGVEPARAAAVEDSHAGIRSAKAAGMRVLAIPNPTYPPDDEALANADVVLNSLSDLTPEAVEIP